MDLDRTNRLFYKNVIINEKRKKDYQELDSLIHSNSFFKTYWTLEHLRPCQTNKTIGLSKLDKPIVLLIRTDITFINQPLLIRVLLLQ